MLQKQKQQKGQQEEQQIEEGEEKQEQRNRSHLSGENSNNYQYQQLQQQQSQQKEQNLVNDNKDNDQEDNTDLTEISQLARNRRIFVFWPSQELRYEFIKALERETRVKFDEYSHSNKDQQCSMIKFRSGIESSKLCDLIKRNPQFKDFKLYASKSTKRLLFEKSFSTSSSSYSSSSSSSSSLSSLLDNPQYSSQQQLQYQQIQGSDFLSILKNNVVGNQIETEENINNNNSLSLDEVNHYQAINIDLKEHHPHIPLQLQEKKSKSLARQEKQRQVLELKLKQQLLEIQRQQFLQSQAQMELMKSVLSKIQESNQTIQNNYHQSSNYNNSSNNNFSSTQKRIIERINELIAKQGVYTYQEIQKILVNDEGFDFQEVINVFLASKSKIDMLFEIFRPPLNNNHEYNYISSSQHHNSNYTSQSQVPFSNINYIQKITPQKPELNMVNNTSNRGVILTESLKDLNLISSSQKCSQQQQNQQNYPQQDQQSQQYPSFINQQQFIVATNEVIDNEHNNNNHLISTCVLVKTTQESQSLLGQSQEKKSLISSRKDQMNAQIVPISTQQTNSSYEENLLHKQQQEIVSEIIPITVLHRQRSANDKSIDNVKRGREMRKEKQENNYLSYDPKSKLPSIRASQSPNRNFNNYIQQNGDRSRSITPKKTDTFSVVQK